MIYLITVMYLLHINNYVKQIFDDRCICKFIYSSVWHYDSSQLVPTIIPLRIIKASVNLRYPDVSLRS